MSASPVIVAHVIPPGSILPCQLVPARDVVPSQTSHDGVPYISPSREYCHMSACPVMVSHVSPYGDRVPSQPVW